MKAMYFGYGGGNDTHLHPCLETSKGPSVGIVNSSLVETTSEKKFSPAARSPITSAILSSVTATVRPHTVASPLESVLKNFPAASSLKVSKLKN